MIRCWRSIAAIALTLAAARVPGATGEETYKTKCSLCHDGGAGAAPRIDDKAAWGLRLADGKEPLYQTALKGKPNTAMMPKGGFPELADAEVRAAVDYMLLLAGYRDALPAQPRPAAATPRAAERGAPTPERQMAPVDDKTITANVAEVLRGAPDISPPNAQLETYEGVTTIRGVGIKVETRDGVVTLRGVIDDAKVISRAEALARTVSGVRGVDNKLVQAALFEHD